MILSSLNTDLCLFLIIFGFFHLFHFPHECRLRGYVKSWSKLRLFFSAVSGDMPVLHKMPIVAKYAETITINRVLIRLNFLTKK